MKLSKISKIKIYTMTVNFLFLFAGFSYMIFDSENVKGDTNQITNIALSPKPGASTWTPCSNTKIILTCTFTGTTLPRAFVRWTTDNWWHTKDTDMVLIEKSGTQLKYEADLGNLGGGTTVKYCACIYTSTETKWANNNGWNYELYIQSSQMVYPSELTHTPDTPKYNEKVTFKTTLSVEPTAKVYLVWTSDGWTNIHEDEMTFKTLSGNERTYQVIKGPFPSNMCIFYCIKVLLGSTTYWGAHFGSAKQLTTAQCDGITTTSSLKSVAWSKFGKYGMFVGASGNVWLYNAMECDFTWGGNFHLSYSRVYTGVTSTLNSVSFQPTDEKLDGKRALVVGSSGTVLFWDGVTFTKINGANGTLNKVSWAPSGQCALIVGSNGGIYKYEGGTITKVESNTTTTFYSVAWHPSGSHAIIVGASGKAYKYNGKSLTKLTTGTTSALYDIAFNPSNGNAIIVGSSGKVLKYNSVSGNFSILQSGTTKTLYGLGYRQLGDYACIVGSSGTILKYDGVSFTKLDIPPGLGTNTIYGVTFPVNGNPWIAASGGKAFQISFLKETAYNYEGVVLYYYPTIRQLVIKIENQQGSLNGDYKYVRLGYNGWASGTIQDVKLVKYQTQSGSKWISAIDLPKNVSTVNFCFHDGAGNWANNNGNNWNVALSTLPQSDVDYSKTRLYGLVHNYYVVVFNGGAIPPQLSLHNIMTQPLFLYRSGTVYFPSSSNGEYSFLVGETGSYLGTVPIFPGRYVIVLPRNSSMLDDAEIINVELKPGYNFVDIYAN